MQISGFQKMTLLDFPGKVACTVFTRGCNFRCPFCHNASLVLTDRVAGMWSEEEILRFLEKRQGLLEGLVLTGGEPLVHQDVSPFLRRVRALGYAVKLDTNGSFPDRLRVLVEDGLVDRVAMDIKNSPDHYARTTGLRLLDIAPIEQSKDYLLEDRVDYEFRTTVVKGLHTEESLQDAARWIAGAKAYFLQQYKDSGDLIAPYGLEAYSDEQMRALAKSVSEIVPSVRLRGVE